MPEQPLRLAIVSRQEVVARGLTAMLADYPDRITVVALASVYGRLKGVDVVLYDSHGLHRSDGGDLDHLIQKTDAKVLVYSRDMRPDLRARAIARGADGWVSMSTHAPELVEAIERAADGKPQEEQVDWIGHEAGLSPREVEVLSLVTLGMSNQDIADRLFLTINTLKSHIRQAYKKIGVGSRAQAVAWCMQHGFAPPDAKTPGE
jgi:DNA-binding NarL/FixJ family response regulator